jgi:hypothetical protein
MESNKLSRVMCSRRNIVALVRWHLEKRPYVESFKNTIEQKEASRVDIAARFVAYDSSVHSVAFWTLAATEKAYELLEVRPRNIILFIENTEPQYCAKYRASHHVTCRGCLEGEFPCNRHSGHHLSWFG